MPRAHVAAMLLAPTLIPALFPVPGYAAQDTEDVLAVAVPPAASDHLADLAPGDRTEWAAQVANTGEDPVPLYAAFSITGTEALVTDPADGLQLDVALCPHPLEPTTVDGGAVVYTCPTATTPLGTGSAAGLGTLEATTALAPGDTVGIRVRAILPVTAGNTFENSEGKLHVDFATTGNDTGQPGRPSPAPTTPPPTDDGSSGSGTGGHGSPPVTLPAAPEKPVAPVANAPDTTDAQPGADTRTNGWTAPEGGLAQTGRNLLAALAGAVVTVMVGSVLQVLSRRRSPTEETSL